MFGHFLVDSHFASVENNILSDIRNFHMNMLHGTFDKTSNRTTDQLQESKVETERRRKEKYDKDQYLISSFKPERQSWSSHEPTSPSIMSSTLDNKARHYEEGVRIEEKSVPHIPRIYQTDKYKDSAEAETNKFRENSKEKFNKNNENLHIFSPNWEHEVANHRQYDIEYSDNELGYKRNPVQDDGSNHYGTVSNGHYGGQFYDSSSGEIFGAQTATQTQQIDHNKHVNSDRFHHNWNQVPKNTKYQENNQYYDENYINGPLQNAAFSVKPHESNWPYEQNEPYSDQRHYSASLRRGPSLQSYYGDYMDDSQGAYNNPMITSVQQPPPDLLNRQFNNFG